MRSTVRLLSLAGLTAVLLAVGTPPLADPSLAPAARALPGGLPGGLPPCPPDIVGPPLAGPPLAGPPGVAGAGAVGAGAAGAGAGAAVCRARPTRVFPARGGLPVPAPGYHHLGATSAGEWSGVFGRITVRDPEVRAGTHDFVATRFMAKRKHGAHISWLEAGWAETGWSGAGRQRIYTFDTRSNSWTFYDQYPLRDGDQIWLYVHTDTADESRGGSGKHRKKRSVWQAWLWWGNGWHLLAAEELPLGGSAQMEQYVEVYVDPRHGSDDYPVPRVLVDNVQVKTDPTGDLRPWQEDVLTAPGWGRDRYCVDWYGRFDTWTAGDCASGRERR